MTIDLHDISVKDGQDYLQAAIAPRPIGLVSTIDKDGHPNLSPFSFFNLFSTNPPIVIFSPSRRLRDNTTKHSFDNLYEVPEAVIHIVTYDMVQQVTLASGDYPKGVNEFIKAGFTDEPATLVRPPMVKESPVKMECKVIEIKPMGKEGGAGNLVFCEVLRIHIKENILNENKQIDPTKLQQVARLGGDWYCRIDPSNLFRVPKPNVKPGIGMDGLPAFIRNSTIFSANQQALLAGTAELPQVAAVFFDERVQALHQYFKGEQLFRKIEQYAAGLLDEGKTMEAWQALLSIQTVSHALVKV